ncbi:MAG: PhnD/SsuA/transferrin family substrate-binding protein [Actinomycetota bacterium]
MGLTAATYLGDNTIPILDALVSHLVDLDVDIEVDPGAGRGSAEARANAAEVDLVWMCGSLAAVLLRDGTLQHDVVAAPVFEGESEAVYRSVFVTRRDGPASVEDALSGTIGINEADSWSGHHALRRHLGVAWFSDEMPTGSHRDSITAVSAGDCAVAGIDVTIWRHVCATEPDAVTDLRVIGRTTDWPAPPFLVRHGAGDLAQAIVGAAVPGLDRIVPAAVASYRPLVPE